MVNQRDTSISKLLLLPDPSRSPKIERRNDLFVNIVSTLIVWRESAWKSTPTLKGTGALEKDTWPQGARETVSDSPTKKISSQLSIFSSLLEYSHVLAEQSNALSLHLSLSLSRRELTSPQQKKKIIQNGSSLFRSIPTGGGFPKIFFFFLSYFITLKLLFSLLQPDLHYIWSGNIRMRKLQKMRPDTTEAIKRCIYEWINQLNAIVQIIRRMIKYLKVSSICETFLLLCQLSLFRLPIHLRICCQSKIIIIWNIKNFLGGGDYSQNIFNIIILKQNIRYGLMSKKK